MKTTVIGGAVKRLIGSSSSKSNDENESEETEADANELCAKGRLEAGAAADES